LKVLADREGEKVPRLSFRAPTLEDLERWAEKGRMKPRERQAA
jgi:hypothetical protein